MYMGVYVFIVDRSAWYHDGDDTNSGSALCKCKCSCNSGIAGTKHNIAL